MVDIKFKDTATVNLSGAGDILTANVIVDPVSGNALHAGPNGLFVSQSGTGSDTNTLYTFSDAVPSPDGLSCFITVTDSEGAVQFISVPKPSGSSSTETGVYLGETPSLSGSVLTFPLFNDLDESPVGSVSIDLSGIDTTVIASVAAGPNTTVTGSGQANDPYVISFVDEDVIYNAGANVTFVTQPDGSITISSIDENTQSTVSSNNGSVTVTPTPNPDGTVNYDLSVAPGSNVYTFSDAVPSPDGLSCFITVTDSEGAVQFISVPKPSGSSSTETGVYLGETPTLSGSVLTFPLFNDFDESPVGSVSIDLSGIDTTVIASVAAGPNTAVTGSGTQADPYVVSFVDDDVVYNSGANVTFVTQPDGSITISSIDENTQNTVSSNNGSVTITPTPNPDGTVNFDLSVTPGSSDTNNTVQLLPDGSGFEVISPVTGNTVVIPFPAGTVETEGLFIDGSINPVVDLAAGTITYQTLNDVSGAAGAPLVTDISALIAALTSTPHPELVGAGSVTVTGDTTNGWVITGIDTDTDTTCVFTNNPDGTITKQVFDIDGNQIGADQILGLPDTETDSTVVQVDAAFIAMYGDTDTTGQTVAIGEWVQLNDDNTFHCLDVKVASVEYIKGEIVEGVQQMTRNLLDEAGNVIRSEQFGVNNSPILYTPGDQLPSGAPIMSVPVVDLPDMSTYRFVSFDPSLGQAIPTNYKGCIAWDVCKGKAARLDAPKRPQLVFTAPKDGATWFDYLSGLTDAQLAEIDILRVNGTLVPDVRCYTSYVDENGIEWTATEGVGWFSGSTQGGGAGSVSSFTAEFTTGTLIGTHEDGEGNPTELYIPATANISKADLAGLVRPTCKAVPIDTDGDGMLDGYEIVVDLIAPQTLDGVEFSFDGQTFGPLGGTTVSEAALPGWADADCVFIQPIVSCDGINIPMDCKTLVQPCKTTSEFLFPIADINLTVCMYFNDGTSPTAAVNWGPHFPERSCIRFEGLTNVPGSRTLNSPQIPYTNTFDCPVELCVGHATALHIRSEDQFGDTGQASYNFDTMLGDVDNVENLVLALNGDAVTPADLQSLIGDGTRLADRNSGTIGPFCPTNTGTNDSVYQLTHLERFKCLVMPGETAVIGTAQILARGNDGLGPDQVRFHHASRMWATTELMKNKV